MKEGGRQGDFVKGERLGNSLQTERSEGEESMRERWEEEERIRLKQRDLKE